jgi:hypothetical protein
MLTIFGIGVVLARLILSSAAAAREHSQARAQDVLASQASNTTARTGDSAGRGRPGVHRRPSIAAI